MVLPTNVDKHEVVAAKQQIQDEMHKFIKDFEYVDLMKYTVRSVRVIKEFDRISNMFSVSIDVEFVEDNTE